MMTTGYLFLGGYCPGIQPYLTRGNATLNDKQIFWKNRLTQLAVITSVSAAIFGGIYYKLLTEIDDPVYTAYCKHVAQNQGMNGVAITAILIKAFQSDNELTRQSAYLTVAGFALFFFTLTCLFKMIEAYMHHRNPNGINVTQPIFFTPEA